ncbi:alpha/beta hydrolase family protein [Streptacidiphilus carbonis]|uniref:alpha/beta hydrolase family protein n=1 Tax=Streptacidiphilus carbonis TaxID=105422 RepID=UPI0006934BCE|nr:alpha/beta fold hydrolase [Streptacidiphilus carbonis]
MTATPLTLVGAFPHTRAAPALRRVGFTFSADGGYAACMASSGEGGWYVESWRLDRGDGPGAAGTGREQVVGGLIVGGLGVPDSEGAPGEAIPVALPQAPGAVPESLRSQLVSLPDGRVLICRRHGDQQHDLVVRTPASVRETFVGTLRIPGLRLMAMPAPGPGGPVAVALGTDSRAVTSVWLVSADGGVQPQQVAEFPGMSGGGVWLDRGGRMLALDHLVPGSAGGTGAAGAAGGAGGAAAPAVKTVVLDLATGTVSPFLELTPRSNDRLVAADPESGLILVRSDAPGQDRLGWGVLGGDQPLRFPDCLHRTREFLRPIAIEPAGPGVPASGQRVAVQGDWGAGSTLATWQPDSGRLETLPVPAGRLGGVGHWSASGLRLPYSSPDHPAGIATVQVDRLLEGPPEAEEPVPTMPLRLAPLQGGAAGMGSVIRILPTPQARREAALRSAPSGWRLDGSAAPGDGGRWHGARTVELAGAAGPMEAVVYGGDTWLTAQHLVIALHGGPADAWRLEFDPALQRMAGEGLAVVAVNQRGSTGYGVEYAQALQNAWGGPDLDDVLALLSSISGQRAALGLEPASLFGVSYGAFLALLAACAAPEQIARCAVVAPFLSGPRLLAEAGPAVQALTRRLGGTHEPEDGGGARDVLRVCHRLAAPLLVVHGDRDEVVPVSQSRTLRQELLRMGHTEGADFRYVEAAGAGHEVLAEDGAPVLHELLAGFLRTGRPT